MFLSLSGLYIYKKIHNPPRLTQRPLTRVTFDDGLQIGATWSPDGRFIAYSSDRGGKFDIWVQQVTGGNPVQVTKGPGQNWQPDWSPDGRFIAYRSEYGEGGLFVVPALGGEGLERKITSFGYSPQWSPDGSQFLFRAQFTNLNESDRFYVVGLDGSAPREVLAEFISKKKLIALSAVWHPDGKRITVWVSSSDLSPNFWTVPIGGDSAVFSEIAPEIKKQFREVSASSGLPEFADGKFSWAPSRKAIYFERTFRGAMNLWKLTVDPNTLRGTALERLTTGSGPDTQGVVSRDGKKLAFTEKTQHIRTWLFPFDPKRGRVTSLGGPLTSPAVVSWHGNLSADGKELAFVGIRSDQRTIWKKSLVDGREAPIVEDDHFRDHPQWSPDGKRIAYRRWNPVTRETQLMVWSNQSRTEEAITQTSSYDLTDQIVFDWSPDGDRLLVTLQNKDTQHTEIWLIPSRPPASLELRTRQKLASDPAYDLYQPHFSSDGRWIVFEAIRYLPKVRSDIFTIPATGGAWTQITKSAIWDDKPRWSPDGKTIYYVSGEGGMFNVWGIRFDTNKGKSIGKPFQVTSLEKPSLKVPNYIPYVGFSITPDKLVITVLEQSGSIWVLDNVDK